MKKLSWTTGVREVKDLLPWQENPRKISKQALDKLKEKIIQNGFHSVIVIDTDNTILSGNQRKVALMELGINTVDVMIPSRKLSDAERRRIGIESNINDGEWDFEKLKSFDLELLQFAGFDEKELVKFWDEEKDTKDDKFDVDKELKKKQSWVILLSWVIINCFAQAQPISTPLKNYSVMIELLLSTVTHLSISGFHMTKAWVINPTTEAPSMIINHQKHTRNLFVKFLNPHLQYLPKTHM